MAHKWDEWILLNSPRLQEIKPKKMKQPRIFFPPDQHFPRLFFYLFGSRLGKQTLLQQKES
eukprot:TRINITY_DN4801_c0_g1_i1.p1 TRINITY_DN4801_c0_g1~~TRINITY_DN4801_c0_g1_i1.p1  ORF type:complete len:61 (+),score=3.62 TRINITY_DN4801_c0_g1_i1:195-377(+)